MTTLTSASFPANEQAAIQDRLDRWSKDVAQVQSAIDAISPLITALQDLDDANKRVQDAAIAAAVLALHTVAQNRSANEPYFVKFLGNFPVVLADLYDTDPFPTIPSYTTPITTADLEHWELWETVLGIPQKASVQPDGVELGAGYTDALGEFDAFQEYRLNNLIGSYTLLARFSSTSGLNIAKLAVINGRNNFYVDEVGFAVTP